MQYTSEQTSIIQHEHGHARIIAVAGSGKTQTLTAYVQKRLADGVPARRLLVLMYNKSAQIDFERRLRAQLDSASKLPDIRTFHSLGYRICQTLVKQGDMLPFKKAILSDGEIEQAVWMILRHLADESIADDVLSRKKKWVEPAVAFIERVKSTLESPEVVFEAMGLPSICRFFIEAFFRFEDWRSDQNRLTFSDLIYEPVQRFLNEPHLAAQFSDHLAEIVVDEFQDINPVQYSMLKTLRGTKAKLIVVGDPDQTIYEFRGSKPSLLTQMISNEFSGLSEYQLSHTFRFGDQLSLLANQVIAGNYADTSKRTQCLSHESTKVPQISLRPINDSAQGAFEVIQQWSKERPLSDIAVINRLWANSARLELQLLAHGVPYRLDNQQTVLERYELRVFRVLMQIAAGHNSQWSKATRKSAWQALLGQPFLKVKKAVTDQLIQALLSANSNWGQALRNETPMSLSSYQSDQLFERARWIEKAERAQGDMHTVVNGWIQATDYFASLKDNAFSASQVEDQVATVKAFSQFVRQSKWSMRQAAAEFSALTERKTSDDQDAVLITSIHKAKGREWPCVVIPEVNKRYYPYQPESEMSVASTHESERRLLYVAITRARDALVLITPGAESEVGSSPFLPEAYVNGLVEFQRGLEQPSTPLKLPAGMHQPSVHHYAEMKQVADITWVDARKRKGVGGATVRHPNLGVGQILKESEKKLSIQFIRDGKTREFDRMIVLPLLEFLPE